jgi:hypothetical protein
MAKISARNGGGVASWRSLAGIWQWRNEKKTSASKSENGGSEKRNNQWQYGVISKIMKAFNNNEKHIVAYHQRCISQPADISQQANGARLKMASKWPVALKIQ